MYSFPRDKLQLEDSHKTPLVLVACGSYSPVTYLHLRMFGKFQLLNREMAKDYFLDSDKYSLIGGYFSPVSDSYAKPGLADGIHRVKMCELAVSKSDWIMVDPWESLQPKYVTTAKVLDHFDSLLNPDEKRIRIMLLAGGDLIESFAVPNLWKERDVDHILGYHGCVIIERTGANVFDFLLSNDLLFKHKESIFS